MEWMRSHEQHLSGAAPGALRPNALDAHQQCEPVPKFVLVDSSNRVRELTGTHGGSSMASGASAAASSSSFADYHHAHRFESSSAPTFAPLPFGSNPMAMMHHNASSAHRSFKHEAVNGDDDFAMSQAELEEQAQLEQQLQVQKEEMRFVSPLPRPQLHNKYNNNSSTNSSSQFRAQSHRPLLFNQHAFSYSDTNSNHQPFGSNPLNTPPTVPPVSPFAGLALSAPTKSTLASSTKLPNPFSAGLSTTVESSPRLPSLNMFRAGSPGQLKMGIAGPRPPPLSLRSTSSDSLSTNLSSSLSSHPSPSSFAFQHPFPPPPPAALSASPSPYTSPFSTPMYSQSLPTASYMQQHERRKSRMSFDGADSVNMSSDDEDNSSHGGNGMFLLSSSVEQAGSNGLRTGRVCRYSDCNNIARSRGLCRTHGGGKRCSHPHCNKSAQANRKCIAHGGGTPCSFDDCEKTAQSRGLCKAHGGGARCKFPDCPKSSQSKGLCRGHGGGIKCKEDGCEKWVQKNGFCIKHGRERLMSS